MSNGKYPFGEGKSLPHQKKSSNSKGSLQQAGATVPSLARMGVEMAATSVGGKVAGALGKSAAFLKGYESGKKVKEAIEKPIDPKYRQLKP